MNWKLIFLLSIPGLVLSTINVYWMYTVTQITCWSFLSWIFAYIIARNAPGKYFLHGFIIGLFNYVLITAVSIVSYNASFNQYYSFYPNMHHFYTSAMMISHPRRTLLFSGILDGVVLGFWTGILSLLFSRYVIKIHNYPKYKKELALRKQQEAQSN